MSQTEAEMTNPEAVLQVKDNGKYISGVNQPRDSRGMFRTVLARLADDLAGSGLIDEAKKAKEAEGLEAAGDFEAAEKAAKDLMATLDRLDSGALDAKDLENIRTTARQMGSAIANAALPFGSENKKLKFSDLPPALKNLIDEMMIRVEKKIGEKDAQEVTAKLKTYKSGSDLFSQGEVSSELSTLLRLLT